ncbi:MAG: protein kinase [Planctomycetes bacterium]|nr:protein kinase [Planctomycetota bacterium]
MSKENSFVTCQKCNEPLETGWKQCPVCLTPTSSPGLACPNCQTPVKETWKACPRCSSMLSGMNTPDSSQVSSLPSSHSDNGQIYLSMEQKDPVRTIGFELEVPIVPGDVLGERYRVVKGLGKGGFGSVYEVEDINLNRKIALKIVVAGKGRAQRATEQLLHEFNLRERINDTTHIIKAQDPRPCEYKGLSLVLLPMELAEGENLRKWLTQNQDGDKRIKIGMEFFKQACCGIKAIHDAGLVHLDIKPENILLVDGKIKMADFGIGRYGANQFKNNPEQLLHQGIGTPQYMSPEQFHVARQKDIGSESDIYSLGVVLFELLDGNLPFDGTPIELRDKHLNMQPPRLTGKLERWWRIVDRCLSKKPEDRYRDIDRLIADIGRVAQGATLSIDVSCPKCSHINANPDSRACDKCRGTLDALFRPCPVCARSVRLDVKTCLGCGKAVAAYYLLLGRKGQIGKLKDEDPVEAIEILEMVLMDGADDYHEHAVKLIKELRRKQLQVGSLIASASNASASGKLEQAIKLWQKVLEVIPRHKAAIKQIEELESIMKGFKVRWDKVSDLMDEAQFQKADKLLQDCLEILPTRKNVKKMLGTCRERARKYKAAFEDASAFAKTKMLKKADAQTKDALTQAPKSAEALSLATDLSRKLDKTENLIVLAHRQLSWAEFSKVTETIDELEQLQVDNLKAKNTRKKLRKAQDNYIASMEEARLANNSKDLDKAINKIEKSLKSCPDSQEAQSFLKTVKAEQDKAANLINEAISAMRSSEFEKASSLLNQVSAIWPAVPDLDKTRNSIEESQRKYTQHLKAAIEAEASLDLGKALEEARSAQNECPDSKEASDVLASIEKKQSKAKACLEDARIALEEARFDDVEPLAVKAKELWPELNIEAYSSSTVHTTMQDYKAKMNEAKQAFEIEDLNKAFEIVKKAVALCPRAAEANELYDSINKILKKRSELIDKTRRQSWIALKIIVAVVLTFLAVVIIPLAYIADKLCSRGRNSRHGWSKAIKSYLEDEIWGEWF